MGHVISIFSHGYAASVSTACFAHIGHKVIGVDVNAVKVERLQSGRSPIVESRMNELIAEGHSAGRLFAATDSRAAVCESAFSLIYVGTPALPNGKLDLWHVRNVACESGRAIGEKERPDVVVLRSTW